MADLFWPGDARAGDLFTERAFLAAMVAVESARADTELTVPEGELDAEAGGNPVIPLLDALRKANPEVALHEGLTSQDVLDSALMLMLRDAVSAVVDHLGRGVEALARLTAEHGETPMTGRTLTQPALPITFGDKAVVWRAGLAEATADLEALAFPVQVGGPVGTTRDGRAALAGRLGLDRGTPRGTPSAGRSPGPATRSSRPPTPAAGSRATCWCWAGPRSASSARRPAAVRRRCRTRPTRSSRSSSGGPH